MKNEIKDGDISFGNAPNERDLDNIIHLKNFKNTA